MDFCVARIAVGPFTPPRYTAARLAGAAIRPHLPVGTARCATPIRAVSEDRASKASGLAAGVSRARCMCPVPARSRMFPSRGGHSSSSSSPPACGRARTGASAPSTRSSASAPTTCVRRTFDGERGIEALLKGLTQLRLAGRSPNTTASSRSVMRHGLGLAGAGGTAGAVRRAAGEPAPDLLGNQQPPARSAHGRPSRWGWASSAWASSPSGGATRCRGCPRAATRSCASTCPRSVRSAWT